MAFAALTVALPAHAAAQAPVERVAPVTDASPLSSSRAVVSIPASGGEPDIVLAGCGGGLSVLQVSTAIGTEGDLSPFGAQASSRIDLGGFVRDLALVGDDVYAAVNRSGVVRLVRSGNTWSEDFRFALPANGPDDVEQAFRLVVWPYTVSTPGGTETGVRIVVGTNDERGGGKLYLLDPDAASPVLDSVAAPGEVWSIAAGEELVAGKFTVLVGTACAGVHRYDLDLNAAAFPAPSTPSPTPLLGKFVRAIEIEDRPGPSDRVFFALNADRLGMYEFDATSFTALVPDFRPDLNGNGIPDVQLWNSLSFDDSSKRLIAGLGPAFAVEKQFGSPSREPLSCIAPDPKPEDGGVAAFSVAANSFLLEASNTDFGGVTDRKQPTAALQFRPVSTTEYYIDAAAGGDGVWSYHATADAGGAWAIERADIGHELNQSVSLTTTDEVLFLDDHLYVSNEDALSSYDRTGPTPASMLLPGSILKVESTNTLAGFSGPEARLYSSGFGALRVYDLDPNAAVPVPGPVPIELDGGGRAFATRANLGAPLLHNPVTGVTGPRWLARVFYTLENSMGASLGTGGIRVIHVGTATNGDDPQVQTVTEWLHRGPWPGTSQLLPNASVRDVAFSGVGNGQYWYVSYGPQPATVIPGTGGTQFYPAETGIGLLTLQVNANPGRPVSLQVVDREHIVTSVDDTDPWRVTYDPVRQAVYVACSSQGFAVFDASNPANPSLIYHRDLFSAPGEVATAYQVQRGPGDQLVISYLDRGLLVIDDWDDPQSSSTLYSTRFQAIGLVPDTSDPSGTSFFVADGRAGALRVTLP